MRFDLRLAGRRLELRPTRYALSHAEAGRPRFRASREHTRRYWELLTSTHSGLELVFCGR